MKNISRLICFVVVLLGSAVLFAADHPNFSGKWKLNVAKSDMGAG